MKKEVKILTTILLILTVICSLTNIVFASDPQSTIAELMGGTASGTDELVGVGASIVGIMQIVGIVVAVVVLLVIGIKYLIGSAEERAEYKKTMIPYIVGAILIFASTTIVNVVFNVANGLNSSVAAG